jgi:hypothetical protein
VTEVFEIAAHLGRQPSAGAGQVLVHALAHGWGTAFAVGAA